ncbi:MAG: GMC family oxidoreductase [Nevskia sp.]|nr:GMC family oxidoreductase [Nevskia sp.]
MAIDDIYTQGIAGGWRVTDASTFKQDQVLEADVVIVGSGAGGGTTAEILSAAGLKVLILEEGPLKTSASFKDMNDARAYGELYQEGAARASADGAVAVLQGRSVGGSTTINWTSSFRTPPPTLKYWADTFALKDSDEQAMAPWFAQMEQRLGVAPWGVQPNANNGALKRGAEALGWAAQVIPRNVRGCWNLGYCGLGCPTNAKQSMLVTTIPGALKNGAQLVHHVSVRTLQFAGGKVTGMSAEALAADCVRPSGVKLKIKARHYVLAGGAINTPALLLRSNATDPYGRIGKRTCIHPVNVSMAQMPDKVEGYYGAPQSVYSDEFQWKHGATGPVGYKLEVAPMQPMLTGTIVGRYGIELQAAMAGLPYMQSMLALLRDGFDEQSPGGEIRIDDAGAPQLHYEFSDYLWDGFRRAYLSMAELQFAAGARQVTPIHVDSKPYASWTEARQAIAGLACRKQRVPVFTAHLMGGCAMGEDEKLTVVDSAGRFRHADNLLIIDGSIFPTSIGANPQLSIYGFACRNATRLAKQLRA